VIGVVGLIARDLVDGAPPRLGGGGWYCARALAVLGQRAVVATKYAPEDHRLAAPLYGLGLEVAWQPAAETATFALTNRGDRRDVAIEAVGEAFTPDEVLGWVGSALGKAAWVHLPALSRADFPPETVAALAPGRTISFDGQGLVRPGRTGPVVRDPGYDPAVLEHVGVLKLSEAEAELVDLDALAVPEVLVTLGSRGVAVRADGREERVATRPLDGIDPTGAGDAFGAAYLVARSGGQGPFEAARSATAVVRGLLTQWRTR
jgi:sugar/nucleoside kinase (ribokinase family)